jgi:hypothetical protein
MKEYFCEKCGIGFEDGQSLKKEYFDYTFGNCWKYVAYCPTCGSECSEKSKPKPGKKNSPEFSYNPGCASCADASGCGMNR